MPMTGVISGVVTPKDKTKSNPLPLSVSDVEAIPNNQTLLNVTILGK